MPPRRVYSRPRASASRATIQKRKKQVNWTKSYKLSKPVDQLVDAKIKKFIEPKQAIRMIGDGLTPGNPPVQFNSNVPVLYQLIPPLRQGLTRDDRQGAQIKVTSLRVEGFIMVEPEDAQNQSAAGLDVRLVAATNKSRPAYSQLYQDTAATTDNMLKNGDLPQSFSGIYSRFYLPTNKQLIRTHHDHKMLMLNNVQGNGGEAIPIKWLVKRFAFNIKMKGKLLQYSAPTDTLPKNAAPFLAPLYHYLDGAAPLGAVPKIWFKSTLNYHDA